MMKKIIVVFSIFRRIKHKVFFFFVLKKLKIKIKKRIYLKGLRVHRKTTTLLKEGRKRKTNIYPTLHMFKRKKTKEKKEGWLYQIRNTPGLKFETPNSPEEISHKQVIRVIKNTYSRGGKKS